MRVLVTGSRSWTDTSIIRDALAQVWSPRNILVHGACPTGADALADECWQHWGGRVERHPSETVYQPCREDCRHGARRRDRRGRSYCPAPPQRRNKRMISAGADLCLAFVQGVSSGAMATARLARRAGIPVRLYRVGPAANLTPQPWKERSECKLTAPEMMLLRGSLALRSL
jgi:hypothetical protein